MCSSPSTSGRMDQHYSVICNGMSRRANILRLIGKSKSVALGEIVRSLRSLRRLYRDLMQDGRRYFGNGNSVDNGVPKDVARGYQDSGGDQIRPTGNLGRMREETLSAAHLRPSRVTIERLDWSACIDRYDRPHTLFFMDPPYWQTEVMACRFPLEQDTALYGRRVPGESPSVRGSL